MKRFIVIGMILSMQTGCAFMVNGGRQSVSFETFPANADIRNNGKFVGTGRAEVELERNTPQNITVSAPGYNSQSMSLSKKMNPEWAFWDIGTCVVGVTLCIPLLIDAVSGAWYGFDSHHAIKLIKTSDAPIAPVVTPTPVVTPAPAPANVTNQQIIIVK